MTGLANGRNKATGFLTILSREEARFCDEKQPNDCVISTCIISRHPSTAAVWRYEVWIILLDFQKSLGWIVLAPKICTALNSISPLCNDAANSLLIDQPSWGKWLWRSHSLIWSDSVQHNQRDNQICCHKMYGNRNDWKLPHRRTWWHCALITFAI